MRAQLTACAIIAACFLASGAALFLHVRTAELIFASDLAGTPDEAGHFTTGVMFYDYARTALGTDPVAFARQYYARYPKVAVGHWPPFFYAVQASWYAAAGPSVAAARWLCGLLALAFALALLFSARRLYGTLAAIVAVVLLASLPVMVRESWLVMSDVLLALCMFGACLAFSRALVSTTAAPAVLFVACAIAAVLTKATGWTLGLFMWLAPAVAGYFSVYRKRWFWLSGLAIIAGGAPFYVLVHRAGLGYSNAPGDLASTAAAALSSPDRLSPLLAALPLPVLALGVAGVVFAWLARHQDNGRRWRVLGSALSVLVAQFPFQFLLNLTPEARYYLPSSAPLVLCAGGGFAALVGLLGTRWRVAAAVPVVALAYAATTVTPGPNGLLLSGYAEACRLIPYASGGTGVLVASDPYGEGAVVVARLLGDVTRSSAVLRGSKVLAHADWNNRGYRLLVSSGGELATLLAEQPVHYVVLDDRAVKTAHHLLLEQFLKENPAAFRLAGAVPVVNNGIVTAQSIRVFEHLPVAGRALRPIRVWLGPGRGDVEYAPR